MAKNIVSCKNKVILGFYGQIWGQKFYYGRNDSSAVPVLDIKHQCRDYFLGFHGQIYGQTDWEKRSISEVRAVLSQNKEIHEIFHYIKNKKTGSCSASRSQSKTCFSFYPYKFYVNTNSISTLARTLIIRNSFRLRRLRVLRCQRQNNHRRDKRHHVINILRQMQIRQCRRVRDIRK